LTPFVYNDTISVNIYISEIVMKKVLIGLGILLALGIIIAMALPSILKSRGLHPDYVGPSYELPGQRALIISTSHGVLNKPGNFSSLLRFPRCGYEG